MRTNRVAKFIKYALKFGIFYLKFHIFQHNFKLLISKIDLVEHKSADLANIIFDNPGYRQKMRKEFVMSFANISWMYISRWYLMFLIDFQSNSCFAVPSGLWTTGFIIWLSLRPLGVDVVLDFIIKCWIWIPLAPYSLSFFRLFAFTK